MAQSPGLALSEELPHHDRQVVGRCDQQMPLLDFLDPPQPRPPRPARVTHMGETPLDPLGP